MNSAGRTGATPISQTSRPLSRSSCVIVERSHRTKNASSSCGPCSAPVRQTPRRKTCTESRTRDHSGCVVGFEHRPLQAAVDGVLEVDEEPAHRDVLPLRVRRQRTRAPHAEATAFEAPDGVHAERGQRLLLRMVDNQLQVEYAIQRLVDRRLVHTAFRVDPRIDADHMTARRHEHLRAAAGIRNAQPRYVAGGMTAVLQRRPGSNPASPAAPGAPSSTAKR